MTEKEPGLVSRPAELKNSAERRAYDDVMHCNRCGFCTSFCPTYVASGEEALSPRGRNQAFRALLENRLSPEQAQKSFDTCLLCGICTSVCFAEVPTARLMSVARESLQKAQGASLWSRAVVRGLLPHPTLFETVMKGAFWFKRWGVSGRLARWGLFRKIAPALAEADGILEKAPRRFLRGQLPPAPREAAVVQFVACGPNLLLPEVGLATAELLRQAPVVFGAAPNVCCGLPGVSLGDREGARRLARKNIEVLEVYPRAVVLVDDSSCAAALKDYPDLLADDPAWRERAVALRARTRDLLEWLAERGEPFKSPPGTVTYHDACKARYGQKLSEEPRAVLRKSRAEVRELPEADQCCGGGGTFGFLHPDLSRAVGDRKIRNILSTGADVVLTSSVSCLLQLRAGLRRAGARVRAQALGVHLVEGDKDKSAEK